VCPVELPACDIAVTTGAALKHLVEALHYKPEGRGFDSFRQHRFPGVESASNSIEYQEYFLVDKGGRCVGLMTLPPSFADYLEIWDPYPPGTLRVCNRTVQ